ncbi:MAG TPA: hypothetical protein VH540_03695 [Ktedonobacterales bacterium]
MNNSGKGTSLRQWKERYQTGHMPGVQPGAPGGSGRLGNRTSGPLASRSGPLSPRSEPPSNDWGNQSPSSSIPPSFPRRSGGLLSGGLTSNRQSGNLTPPPPSRTGDTPPPPSERRSGLLNNPGRSSSTSGGFGSGFGAAPEGGRRSESTGGFGTTGGFGGTTGGFGNRSDSWKWQNRPGGSETMLPPQMAPEADYGQGDEEAPRGGSTQTSGRFRSGSLSPVPYQGGRRSWNQSDPDQSYDEPAGSSPNLPARIEPGVRGGFPALPDEEIVARLAPGRKPPAFIPATRARRPYKLGRYRIVSGILSLVIVVLAVGGGLGFLAVHTGAFAKIFGAKTLAPFNFEFPQPTTAALSGTPQPTPGDANAVKVVVKVTTAKNYTNTYDPVNITSTFKVNDTVNVLWQVRKAKANDAIMIKWYQDGSPITNVDQKNTQETIAKDGDWNGVFGLAYPSASVGSAELYYNGTLAWTIQFVITN